MAIFLSVSTQRTNSPNSTIVFVLMCFASGVAAMAYRESQIAMLANAGEKYGRMKLCMCVVEKHQWNYCIFMRKMSKTRRERTKRREPHTHTISYLLAALCSICARYNWKKETALRHTTRRKNVRHNTLIGAFGWLRNVLRVRVCDCVCVCVIECGICKFSRLKS